MCKVRDEASKQPSTLLAYSGEEDDAEDGEDELIGWVAYNDSLSIWSRTLGKAEDDAEAAK